MVRMKRLAFFLPFQGCDRRCVYCDQRVITGNTEEISPEAVEKVLVVQRERVELCFFGGSFARLPWEKWIGLLDTIEKAPTGSKISFSSYPGDFTGTSGEKRIELLKTRPIGTIELGVPSLDPTVLRACGRGDDPREILAVISRLKEAGFHLGVQIMIGLPGQRPGRALEDLRALAAANGETSMELRIYPCLVLRGTELQSLYENGDFEPLSLKDAIREAGALLLEAEALGLTVLRVGLLESETLKSSIVAGPYHPAFGELAHAEKLALRLCSESPHGPWELSEKGFSQLMGHGGRGLDRMSEISSLSPEEVRKRIVRILQK